MTNKIAVIRNGCIVYDTEAHTARSNETAAHERREAMKTKHRKDLLQPNQVDYYKAYPDKAQDLNPDLRRLLS